MPGEQGWDLLSVEDSTARLYLSHGDRIEVVDLASGKSVGTVAGLKGAHGVVAVPSLGKGFATSGKDSAVVVFDLGTLATVTRLPVGGAKPDAIFRDPATGRLFVGLAGSDALAVVDPVSLKVVGQVKLEGNPELMAADGKGMLYVAVEERSQVTAIDALTLKVKAVWPLGPGKEPTGLAMDSATGHLFAGCANRLLVELDAKDGHRIGTAPIGDRIDGVAFDPKSRRVFASGGDGTLTVLQEGIAIRLHVVETVKTRPGARTLAVDPRSGKIYLPTAEFGPMPTATKEQPKPRPPVVPGSFMLLEVSSQP